MEGFTTQEDQEMLSRIEKQLKRRFAIGSQVSEHSIVQDFTKQVSMLPSHLFKLWNQTIGALHFTLEGSKKVRLLL